jgi:hypothetical protein
VSNIRLETQRDIGQLRSQGVPIYTFGAPPIFSGSEAPASEIGSIVVSQ